MNAQEILEHIFTLTTKEKYPDIHLNETSLPIVRNHSGDLVKLEFVDVETGESTPE